MECSPFQGNNAVTEKPSTQGYLVRLLGTPCYKYQVEHQQLWVTQFVNTKLSLILHVLYFNFYLFIFILFLYSSCFLFPFKPRVLVVAYRRSYDAIKDVGRNLTVVWKPDSTAMAVTVSIMTKFLYILNHSNLSLTGMYK